MKYYTTIFRDRRKSLEDNGLMKGTEVYQQALTVLLFKHPGDELLVELELNVYEVSPYIVNSINPYKTYKILNQDIPPIKIESFIEISGIIY